MVVDGESLNRFFKQQDFRFGKCLEPTLTCAGAAIRAHSIQNAKVFDLISDQNHVAMFKPRFSKEGPSIELKKIGRNEASTFTGFCSQHDGDIFRRLDTEALDLADTEQLFLLAYRSVSRELHATMEGAVKLQSAYQDRVARGVDAGNVPTPAGMEAVSRMFVAWQTHKYRSQQFDQLLVTKNFGQLEHDVVEMDGQNAVLAASCLFSLDEIQIGDDCARVVLNVLPVSCEKTVAIFSFAKKDAGKARLALDRTLTSTGFLQKYEISKLLLERTENFAVSPCHVASWSAEKLEAITAAFQETLFENGIKEDERLMLF
jgi:hypothetical protein